MNEPDHIFTGVNDNDRLVGIYIKDGTAVITDAGDKTSVITALGRDARPPMPDYTPSRWSGDPNYVEVDLSGGGQTVVYPLGRTPDARGIFPF